MTPTHDKADYVKLDGMLREIEREASEGLEWLEAQPARFEAIWQLARSGRALLAGKEQTPSQS